MLESIKSRLEVGKERRSEWCGERDRLDAICEANAAEVEAQRDHPLYLDLADHCESGPWLDRVIVGWEDVRDSIRRCREEYRR